MRASYCPRRLQHGTRSRIVKNGPPGCPPLLSIQPAPSLSVAGEGVALAVHHDDPSSILLGRGHVIAALSRNRHALHGLLHLKSSSESPSGPSAGLWKRR